MKSKEKRRPFSRVVCVLLTVLTVIGAMSSLFIAGPLEAKAASLWTITKASSDWAGHTLYYYGYDYENGVMVTSGEGLPFDFTSGYEVKYGDQIYHASCASLGYAQPTNAATFKGLKTISATGTHRDLFNNRKRYGAHYIGDETDPTWNDGRSISYDFIFRCWYYANKRYGTPIGEESNPSRHITWDNCWLQEAISIAYRNEWDTRILTCVTGHFVDGKWEFYSPFSWTINSKFSKFAKQSGAVGTPEWTTQILPGVAETILRAAINDEDNVSGNITNIDPNTGKRDNYGIFFKDENDDVHVLRLLDVADQGDGASVNYQDLFLYAVNEKYEEKYNIDLTKVDKDSHSVPLSGAGFTLYQKNAGGTYTRYDDDTTDSSGHINWRGLPAGDYMVRETSAPSGYELNSTEIKITLPGSGSTSSSGSYELKYTSEGSEVTVYDPKESYKVAVQKEDSRYTEQRRYLTGAWFALYKKNSAGEYVQYGTEQETKQRDVGLCAYWSGLPKGDYYVKETRAPSGYALNTTPVYFSLPYTDADGERGSTYRINQWNDSNADLFMSNVKYGNLQIKKVDIKGNPISGVKFELWYDKDKVAFTGETATTGADGVATFTDLVPGTYYLFETYAPSGYKFDPSKYYSGTVVSDTTTWANGGYGVENPPYSYSIHIQKTKAGGSDGVNGLEGAKFALYKKIGSNWVYQNTKTSDFNGDIYWRDLTEGDYYYIETEAPRGYELDTTPHYVSFPEDGDGKGNYTKYNVENPPEAYWTPQAKKVLRKATTITENDFGYFIFILEKWDDKNNTWSRLSSVSINSTTIDDTVDVIFDEIKFHKEDAGTHKYQVREVKGNNKMVSYDDQTVHVVTFNVTVTYHRGTGFNDVDTLTVSETHTGSTTFTNYVPSGSWKANASKVLVGRWLDDDEFTFTLEENVGGTWTTLQTVKNREDHVVPFAGIDYTLADVGTHKYRVCEVKGTDPTVIYDDHIVIYTVIVSYDRSNETALTITEGVSSDGYGTNKKEITTFTNYVPVKIEIEKDDPDGKTLAGAEFCLEWSEDGTTWANVKYTAEIEKGGCENADVVDGKLTTDDDGKIAYERLYPGLHYRLTETKAPSGMQLLTETAYEGVLPPDMTVTDPETLVSLRVVNQPVFTLPATGGHGFWNAALAVPLLCVSIAIIGLALGGGFFKKKKQK